MNRRGFMLLEILLAATAATLVAIAGFALLDRVRSRVVQASERVEMSDLACSALAMMEAGLVSPENLHGSLHRGVISLESVEAGVMVRDPKYRLEIDSTPSAWSGLVQVDVSVFAPEGDSVLYTVSQLIPTRGSVE
ncbi:MAG: hypothetical protein KDA31_06480 [Phycisphaerales bacterium]|nr:hypothetical protein [Phycisphaerales bacterium]MCB9836482.1 hypothetical protein [Phycisphaera sp.]